MVSVYICNGLFPSNKCLLKGVYLCKILQHNQMYGILLRDKGAHFATRVKGIEIGFKDVDRLEFSQKEGSGYSPFVILS